ncbi:T. congolense-specific, putative cell surface-expressed gene family [Trypanosoma congolense IL3000]|uniref:T. congolense-specific, putative cell surface-expressed gene family n=1 Tax=Trypanosoma congolense (strain IL3000) TaxID=1068625 RepID=F9WAE6_TRYCI|nr:T. congolense-specific, putative cell surface-expressed gene family [Trypanosoma congolense IL3000]
MSQFSCSPITGSREKTKFAESYSNCFCVPLTWLYVSRMINMPELSFCIVWIHGVSWCYAYFCSGAPLRIALGVHLLGVWTGIILNVFLRVCTHPDRGYGLMSLFQTWAFSVELIANGSTARGEGNCSHRKFQDLSLLCAGADSQFL